MPLYKGSAFSVKIELVGWSTDPATVSVPMMMVRKPHDEVFERLGMIESIGNKRFIIAGFSSLDNDQEGEWHFQPKLTYPDNSVRLGSVVCTRIYDTLECTSNPF
jgi:hypothetical protein